MEKIAIIGAGITGCLVARELLAAVPTRRITLIERDLVGCGASQRSAGIHFPIGATDRVRSWAAFSAQYYRDLTSRIPGVPIFPLHAFAACSQQHAAEYRSRFVSPRPLENRRGQRLGPLGDPGDLAVWHMPGSQCGDVAAIVQTLARELRNRVALLEGMVVEKITERMDSVTVTLACGDEPAFDRLVLAPGPWVNATPWQTLTEPLGVRVKKVVALHFDYPLEEDKVAVLLPEEDAFVVPLPYRQHWLFSYTCPEWGFDPDVSPLGVTSRNLCEARDVLRRYSPELAATLRSGRVFCDAYSPTREPLVTGVGHSGRIVFSGAANGSGYRLGPAIADETARLLA
jgi:D-arginine dehydrogenase